MTNNVSQIHLGPPLSADRFIWQHFRPLWAKQYAKSENFSVQILPCRYSTPLYCHKMAEPTDINTVFVSTISLLRVLQRYHKQTLTIRELQDQVLALSKVLLLLINGANHVVEIYQLYKHPLLRCGEGCDYLKKIMGDSTATAENLCWNRIFRHTRDMLSTYTSTFIIGFAGNNL